MGYGESLNNGVYAGIALRKANRGSGGGVSGFKTMPSQSAAPTVQAQAQPEADFHSVIQQGNEQRIAEYNAQVEAERQRIAQMKADEEANLAIQQQAQEKQSLYLATQRKEIGAQKEAEYQEEVKQKNIRMATDYDNSMNHFVGMGDTKGLLDYVNNYGDPGANISDIRINQDGSVTVATAPDSGSGGGMMDGKPVGIQLGTGQQESNEITFPDKKTAFREFFGKMRPPEGATYTAPVDPKKGTVSAPRPYVAKLMAEGWRPAGRITGPMLDSMEAAASYAEANGLPFGVEQAYSHDFQGVKNTATGRSAGSRLVVARAQNIEAAYGLLDDMSATSKELDYSGLRFVDAMDKWQMGQRNDPKLTEYMTQRADALFVLGNALKQNGLTDKSIEVEEEAAKPTMDAESFDAWMTVQLRALDRAAMEMNRDYKTNIQTSGNVTHGRQQPQGQQPQGQQPQGQQVNLGQLEGMADAVEIGTYLENLGYGNESIVEYLQSRGMHSGGVK